MKYTLVVLIDGALAYTRNGVTLNGIPEKCELKGPDLWDFTTALKLTGKAMDVFRDAHGVIVTIAHEEI